MPKVYVGTYKKYNDGSIAGKWLDLEDYADKEDFLKACAELHNDEEDPEFMFQDFEDVPKHLISESHIDEKLWEWLELSEDDRELLQVYQENVNQDGNIDEARDAYMGTFNSEEAWAENFLEDTGGLESIPENLRYYFDYEKYARDCKLGGDISFVQHGGEIWVFSNH